jgi:hypothetical protein
MEAIFEREVQKVHRLIINVVRCWALAGTRWV